MSKLPGEWKVEKFQNIATVVDCKHRTPKYADSGIPIISPGNIAWGALKFIGCKTISYEEYENLMNHCEVHIGDLVMSRNQTYGVAAYVVDETPFALGQDTILIQPNDVNSIFLYFSLQSDFVQTQIAQLSSGSTFKRINLKDIRRLNFILPPLPEQRKIACILSTWDEAIQLVEALITALKERKRGLMQRLLTGEVRFPGFDGEWEEVRLGDVAEIIMGQSPPSEAYNSNSEGLPLIQGNADIQNRQTSPRSFTSIITKLCQIGDIIMSVRAPVGEISRSLHDACIGRGVAAIRVTNGDTDFMYQLMVFTEVAWQRLAQGSTFTAVNSSDLKTFQFIMPSSINEQTKISDILNRCDSEIERYNLYATHLREQKKGLMQRLLTGEVRVRV